MTSTLALSGDDADDLLLDIEQTFEIKFAPNEALNVNTIGDLLEVVLRNLNYDALEQRKCATSMCFYRLRRAIGPHVPDVKLRPETPVETLRRVPFRKLRHLIESEAGLRAPRYVATPVGYILLASAFLLPLTALAFQQPWWAVSLSAVFSLALVAAMPRRLPPKVETFGDLVNAVASQSLGRLAKQGARVDQAQVWEALREIAAEFSDSAKDIGPETLIYPPPSKKAKGPA